MIIRTLFSQGTSIQHSSSKKKSYFKYREQPDHETKMTMGIMQVNIIFIRVTSKNETL